MIDYEERIAWIKSLPCYKQEEQYYKLTLEKEAVEGKKLFPRITDWDEQRDQNEHDQILWSGLLD